MFIELYNQLIYKMIENTAARIRALREAKHYTQEYMARHLSLSIRAYSKIETGETQLTINRLNEISAILDISPLDILQDGITKLYSGGFSKKSSEENPDAISMKHHYEETIAILKDQVATLKSIIEKMKF